ncbi:hypothetical protein POVWA2_034510 [Plasmodium ovale wallikeri]|uniref:Uncharacterized protein n=1 Tax=Plasmodium ovale wallikeri TaxID=864142 RepID=A0A1A8Z1N1_PLAOA|nr:hypothetical protein POVWA2_034510 [Plasmodium ovale wallikeri]
MSILDPPVLLLCRPSTARAFEFDRLGQPALARRNAEGGERMKWRRRESIKCMCAHTRRYIVLRGTICERNDPSTRLLHVR